MDISTASPPSLPHRSLRRAVDQRSDDTDLDRMLAELTAGAELVFDGPSDRCPCHRRWATAA